MYCILRNFSEQLSEASAGDVFLKKVFLKISQNSQENTTARVFFLNKAADDVTLL